MEALKLPYRKCKFCKHLDDSETTSYNCYGTKRCPATEVMLVVENRVYRIVKAVLEARAEKDLEKEAHCLRVVAKMSDAFKQRFFEMLEQKTKS